MKLRVQLFFEELIEEIEGGDIRSSSHKIEFSFLLDDMGSPKYNRGNAEGEIESICSKLGIKKYNIKITNINEYAEVTVEVTYN